MIIRLENAPVSLGNVEIPTYPPSPLDTWYNMTRINRVEGRLSTSYGNGNRESDVGPAGPCSKFVAAQGYIRQTSKGPRPLPALSTSPIYTLCPTATLSRKLPTTGFSPVHFETPALKNVTNVTGVSDNLSHGGRRTTTLDNSTRQRAPSPGVFAESVPSHAVLVVVQTVSAGAT